MTRTIRPLRAEDHAEWRRLWTLYLEFYETKLSDEIFATTFQRLISAESPRQNALVAEEGTGLVGLVHYIWHPHNWSVEEVCYLQDLFVDSNQRGKGTGSALIKAVYAAADLNGTPNVYWTTQHFNATARRLYDEVGELTPFIKYRRPG